MKSRLNLIVVVVDGVCSRPALQLHTIRVPILSLTSIVTIEGTVTEWSWRSPHVWMKVESAG